MPDWCLGGHMVCFVYILQKMHLRFWNVGTLLRSIHALQGLGPKRSNISSDGAFKKHQAATLKPSKVHLRFAAICADDQAHKSYLSSNMLTDETRLVQTNYFFWWRFKWVRSARSSQKKVAPRR
jgi:hypothetical protein